MTDVAAELTAPSPVAVSGLASRLESGLASLGITGESTINNPGGSNATVTVAPSTQPVMPATPQGTSAPQEQATLRDPETGRFVAKAETPTDSATKTTPPDSATTQAASSSPSSKTVTIYGLEVPIEEAEEVLTGYQEMARQELTTKQAELDKRLADMEAKASAKEASIKAREEEIDAAFELYKNNPDLFVQTLQQQFNAGQVPQPQRQTQPSVAPEQVAEIVRRELAAAREADKAQAAQAKLEAERESNFHSSIHEARKSLLSDQEMTPLLKKAISSEIALALNEKKINPLMPKAILKRQIVPFIKRAIDEVRSEFATLAKRQEAVNNSVSPPVVGGHTAMPRQEPQVRSGPFDPSQFNSRIVDRYNSILSSGGGNI